MKYLLAILCCVASSAFGVGAEPPGKPIDVKAASRITLEMKGVAPKDAFAQLAKQSGMFVRPYPPNMWESRDWPAIDVSLKNATFWTAVRELCDKTGLSLQRIGLERDLYLMQGANRGFAGYPTVEHGPFLIVAQSIQRNHQIDLSRGVDPQRRCDVRFSLYAEPRITVVKGDARAIITEVIDENGLAMSPVNSAIPNSLQTARSWMWPLSGSIALPENTGRKLARLKGAVRLQVQTRSAFITFEGVLARKDVAQTFAGRRVVLKEVKKANAETYSVQLEIHRDPARPTEWNDLDIYSTFRMEDAEGRSLTRRNPGGRGAGGTGILNLTLTFGQESWAGGAGEPARLIWEMPLETGEIEVPFEFTDLPLP